MNSSMFNRRVTLVKPAPKALNDVGQLVTDEDPFHYPVWANWKESGGGESLSEEQEFSADTISITCWWHKALADIKPNEWWLIDERGNELDIVSVTETAGGRNWQLQIKAVRRV